MAQADLDTDDTAYLNFSSNSGQSTQYKYSSAPYMNQKITIDLMFTGGEIEFKANGQSMEVMRFTPRPFQIAIAVSSVPWKSGDNVTRLYSVRVLQ
jgi:hypothetical protein